MAYPDAITEWFHALQAGDREGAQQIWGRFSRPLLKLARKKLLDSPRRVRDEEDVVLSAFDSFCRAAERGDFTQVEDREELWQLLVVITVRKAIDYRKFDRRQRRGGDQKLLDGRGLDRLPSSELGPETAAMLADECRRLMGLLNDPELCSIATLRLEGYTVDEIANRLDCAERTVQRRLGLIRRIWERGMS
jgi:DNA-directed RNA polymerase specialized sigma24 family protein